MIKKVLPLLLITSSLVLCGCTNEKCENNHTHSRQNQIYNVNYVYDFDAKNYQVLAYDKEYRVDPKNYYDIEISEWSYTDDHKLIYNEFYASSLELFVYHRN